MATYFVKNVDIGVSPSDVGDDALDGLSDLNAWKTIGKVNGFTFALGDIVQFKRDSIFTDAGLIPPRSGASGNPNIFRAYGVGAKPHIRGSDDVLGVGGDWTEEVAGVRWSRTFVPDSDSALNNGYVLFGTSGNRPEGTSFEQALVGDVDAAGEWFYDSGAANKLDIFSVNNPTVDYTSLRAISRLIGIATTSFDWLDFENIEVSEWGDNNVETNGSTDINFTEVEDHHSGRNENWDLIGTSARIKLLDCCGYRGGGAITGTNNNTHGVSISDSATDIEIDGMPASLPNGGNCWGQNGEDGFTPRSTGAEIILKLSGVVSRDNEENGVDHKNGNVEIEDFIFGGGTGPQLEGIQPIVMQPGTGHTLKLTLGVCDLGDGHAANVFRQTSGDLTAEQVDFLGADSDSDCVSISGSSVDGYSFENCLMTKRNAGAGSACLLVDANTGVVGKVNHCDIEVFVNKRAVRMKGTGSGSIDLNNSIFVNDGTAAVIEQDVTGGTGEITSTKGNVRLYKRTGTVYVDNEGTDYNSTEVNDGTLQAAEGYGDNWTTAADPDFVDPANDNFALKNTSPALKSASSGSTTVVDRKNLPRPQVATNRAVGCFELEFPGSSAGARRGL